MTRKFESIYRLRLTDDVYSKLNDVLKDLDLRADAIEIIATAFKAGNRLDVDALIASINSDFAQKSAAFQDVLDEITNGLTPDRIIETAAKRFTSDAEISALQQADQDNSTALTNGLATKVNSSTFVSHRDNTENPHGVTKSQVGLGNVDNTADVDKPVSTAQQTALDLKADASTTYTITEVNTALGGKLSLSGGTMSGVFQTSAGIKMGTGGATDFYDGRGGAFGANNSHVWNVPAGAGFEFSVGNSDVVTFNSSGLIWSNAVGYVVGRVTTNDIPVGHPVLCKNNTGATINPLQDGVGGGSLQIYMGGGALGSSLPGAFKNISGGGISAGGLGLMVRTG